MSHAGIVALLVAVMLIFSALTGFSVVKPWLRITLGIIAWLATVVTIFYIVAIWGGNLFAIISIFIILLARLGVDFVVSAIVVGKDNGDITEFFGGLWFTAVAICILAIILVLVVAAIVALGQALEIPEAVDSIVNPNATN